MNITISIQAPELVQAIQSLAASFSNVKGQTLTTQHLEPVQQAPIQQPGQQAPIQQMPVQQPMNMQTQPQGVPTAPPVQQQPPAMQQAPVQQQPQGVPTSAPSYTMDQLAVAATQLMDAGRQQDLLGLLATFGAQSLMQLPKDQYGAFATKLREMGAKI
ncbi:hypothetical protein M670_00475 [Schinkia azotoformans MEV2011]|uniref:Uncharacterized protein n=1 Tax=Schinkia azotoformans MEV2011 TaxID=1348973 RepID=A0A072NRV6_SCHAZ|nr:hypothetical protein [Schinkia azotoformans]KEF40449.1 hypothetical protein M670_00475 [Schinkia azotoformans MEV2011]MEC1696141.1 hypothetical protein [Schinkia azotoformans]MEC1716644.1 hypothetical protein [Schinkia azotoformans]MEC1725356.1 hypothetical protein [Schinkia azotoformans]MEC1739483.1 hypothetical protein [Schinkia azotoformans]